MECLAALGLHPGCTIEQARDRYRSLAKVLHPDKNKDPGAEARFLAIKEALLHLEEDPTLLQGSRSITALVRGSHVRMSVSVDAKQLFFGEGVSVVARRKGRCPCCKGTGSTDLSLHPCALCEGEGSISGGIMRLSGSNVCPQCAGAGVSVPAELHCVRCKGSSLLSVVDVVDLQAGPATPDGQVIVIPGKGDDGTYCGTPGDLLVKLHVESSPGLEYRNGRVVLWLDASPAQYVVGDTVSVSLLGEMLKVVVPPLTGRADVAFRGKKLLVRFNLVMPIKVDAEARNYYGRILALEQGKEFVSERNSRRGEDGWAAKPGATRDGHGADTDGVRGAKAHAGAAPRKKRSAPRGRGEGTNKKPPAAKR